MPQSIGKSEGDLRDLFAATAISGLISNGEIVQDGVLDDELYAELAFMAYRIADAMMAGRGK